MEKPILNSLSLVIPVLNEEEVIQSSLEIYGKKLRKLCRKYEIIVVDDGSTDSTSEILQRIKSKNRNIQIVTHKKNMGVGKAIIDGFKKAKYEWVLHNSADRPFDLDDLKKTNSLIKNSDVIVFTRKDRSANSLFRKATSFTSYFLVKILFQIPIKDFHFVQMYRRKILSSIEVYSNDTFLPPELLIKLYNKKYRINQIKTTFHKRTAGKSKYSNPMRYITYLRELGIFWLKLHPHNFMIKHWGLIIISTIYILSFLYMLPLRDQAYFDDFAYMQSVRNSLLSGRIIVSEWSSASLIFQVIWGSAFAKIFGFSLKTMHFSIVILEYVGTLAFWGTLRKLKIGQLKSILFTSAFFLSPWIFRFTYTFMTDVPYVVLLCLSIYLYISAFQSKKTFYFILGNISAFCAFLIRQTGLLIPISILSTYIIYIFSTRQKLSFLRILQSVGLFTIFIVLYFIWLYEPGNLTLGQFIQIGQSDLLKLFPETLGRIGIPQILYLDYLHRIPLYVNHLVGFMFPLALAFTFKKDLIPKAIKKYKNMLIYTLIISGFFWMIYQASHDANHYAMEMIQNFPDSPQIWDYMLAVSYIFTIPLITIIARKILYTFFQKRNHPFKKFYIVFIILIFLLVLFEARVYLEFIKYGHYRSILEGVNDVIIQTWTVSLTFFITAASFLYVFLKYKLKPKSNFTINIGFITILWFSHLIFLAMLMRQPWPEYVIVFIPLTLMGLAYLTKNVQTSPLKTAISIALIFLIGVIPIKISYSYIGIRWEIETKLVEGKKVAPSEIPETNWAWIPWWYYESSFNKEVQEVGGDKYQIKDRQPFFHYRLPNGQKTYYKTIEVPLDFNVNKTHLDIVLDSGPEQFNLLYQKRYIIYKATVNDSR